MVASFRLSLRKGREATFDSIVFEHSYSPERPLSSPPLSGLAYLRTSTMKAKYEEIKS